MDLETGFDSTYRYVLVAARRARQLQNGSHPLVESGSRKPSRVAQEEIAAGKVSYVKPANPLHKPEVPSPDIPKFVIG